jgi:hypothetical protein
LLRVCLVIAIIGLVLFEAGSVAWNYFGVDSTADDIAFEVAASLSDGVQVYAKLEDQAKSLAKESGAKLLDLKITAEDVQVKIRREATTFVISRVDAIADWGTAAATGRAPTS